MVSECPLGEFTSKGSFVRRDRIQSGLSLGVFPVQTDVDGGTMHTVGVAGRQGRLLACPKPQAAEAHLKQYAGIIQLVHEGKADEFEAVDYPLLLNQLEDVKARLLGAGIWR